MKTTLAILAVTLMKTGVCIAGVRAEEPSVWVRPVREFGTVLLGDVTYPGSGSSPGSARRVMRPFDLVEFQLDRLRPDPPHIEDYTCDFSRNRPRLAGIVPEESRAALLAASATTPALWGDATRSLGSLAVEQLSATFTADTYTGKYEARLTFPGMPADMSAVACTDLKWRALGRSLLAHAPVRNGDVRTLTLGTEQLNEALGGPRAWWLALGSTRTYHGRPWPLIVGVHTVPDYEATVDYSAL